MTRIVKTSNYKEFVRQIKDRVNQARTRALKTVNQELVMLYWDIGRNILEKQQEEGWGTKVIDRLSTDLSGTFPDMKGFSPRNLKYMRKFASAWPDQAIVQQAAAQLPWSHIHLKIIRKQVVI